MQYIRLIFILLLLLTGNSSAYASSSEMPLLHSDTETKTQLSEDFQDLSPSRISALTDIFKERVNPTYPAILSEENCRENSRDVAYISKSRFIKPGLSLPDIIFPFHTFL